MITVHNKPAYYLGGQDFIFEQDATKASLAALVGESKAANITKEQGKKGTIAYSILASHNQGDDMENLRITFDAMASHDITYVGIVQTARKSGMTEFPMPYVLTNCHNSLSAVGGTINEDDHVFGLSAAKKYGGIYVPAHQAVIHQYIREMQAGCGKMILGSDSHTRYGSLGTLGIGEGGPELAKQLVGRTYDLPMPEVVAVHLKGALTPGVGPMDVALTLVGATFSEGTVKNTILEFVGEGIHSLSAEDRIGIDVMTTETTCLSSIWETDQVIADYLTVHQRPEDYQELKPEEVAYYSKVIEIDLSKIVPMIAMPFHPSNVYSIEEFNKNLPEILTEVEATAKEQLGDSGADLGFADKVKDGKFYMDQAIIVGCSGGNYENISAAADILKGHTVGDGALALSLYPSSQPVNIALTRNGVMADLMASGAIIRTAFCGPCFGAGDVPANNAISARHATRNFPNREGSKPGDGQVASVALMDSRSIAATVRNKGALTPATAFDVTYKTRPYTFDKTIYDTRCYNGYGNPQPEVELVMGPNITDWPEMQLLAEDLLLRAAAVITDPVTTTDELIPSGETSSYRSNPLRLAEYTLSRKEPRYVGKAKETQQAENSRLAGEALEPAFEKALEQLKNLPAYSGRKPKDIGIGSVVYAVRPGDGSAREQAASSQKVLGTYANIAKAYATKRYRSNLINWGMLPFEYKEDQAPLAMDDFIYVPNIRTAVAEAWEEIPAYVLEENGAKDITLTLGQLTGEERNILLSGCLMNYYSQQNKK